MSLEAFGVRYVSFELDYWVPIGVGVATLAVVFWEEWEARVGRNRPAIKVTAGMMLSFLGGMSVELGLVHLRFGTINYGWIFQIFVGVVCLFVAVHTTMLRKRSRSVIEWLNERAKPPLMFGKKED